MNFNTRQLKYREYRLQGMTKKSSALKAGYSLKTAEHSPLDKVVDLGTALEMAGMTNKVISDKITERFLDNDSLIGHRYLETALKLMGAKGYSQDKAQSGTQQVQINISIPESGIAPRQI